MSFRHGLCFAVSLGFLVLPGCGGGGGGGGTTGPTPPDDEPLPPGVDAEIVIGDDFFEDPDGNRNSSASVTIQVGETVRWSYELGSRQHTVTSGEGGTPGDGTPEGATRSIESGPMSPGDTFDFTFETAGTWTYFCEIHPGVMRESTVIVE